MGPAELAAFGVAGLLAIATIYLLAMIGRLKGEIEDLRAKLAQSGTPPKPEEKKPEPPPRKTAKPVRLDGPEGREIRDHAIAIIRNARVIAKHLGFDSIPDRSRPTVYRVSVPLASPLDEKAADYLADRPFDCVCEVKKKRTEAVLLLDVAKNDPK